MSSIKQEPVMHRKRKRCPRFLTPAPPSSPSAASAVLAVARLPPSSFASPSLPSPAIVSRRPRHRVALNCRPRRRGCAQVDVGLSDGSCARGGVLSGASTGIYKALELREGGPDYLGRSVLKQNSSMPDLNGSQTENPVIVPEESEEQLEVQP